MNKKLRDRFQAEQNKLDNEQENSNRDYEKMKAVFEKKIQLYQRYLTNDELTDADRLMLSNKKEWIMSHMLSLIINEDITDKISELTKRVYEQEQQQQAIVARLEEDPN